MFLGVILCAISALSSLANASEWTTAYHGYGYAGLVAPNTLLLAPKASTRVDETHAALLLSKKTEAEPTKDFKITLNYKINAQLRTPAATVNAWETLWIFFNYQPDGQFKKTNYLIVKPNGIEIGKAWGDRGQSFSYTAAEPRMKPTGWQQLSIQKVGSTFTVQMNGGPKKVITLPEDDTLFQQAGSVGLYSEDASVTLKDTELTSL